MRVLCNFVCLTSMLCASTIFFHALCESALCCMTARPKFIANVDLSLNFALDILRNRHHTIPRPAPATRRHMNSEHSRTRQDDPKGRFPTRPTQSAARPQPPQASSRAPCATSPPVLSASQVSCRARPAPARAPYTGGTKPQQFFVDG